MSTEQDSSEANTIPYDPNASFSASLSNESLEQQQQQREQNESDHTNNSSIHPSNNSTVSTTGYHGDTEGPSSHSLSSSHSQQRSSSSGQRSDQSQRIKENSNEFSQPFPRTKSYEGSFEHLNRENDRLLRDGNEHGSQNSIFTPPEVASLKRGNTFPYDRPSKIAAKALEERDGIKSQNDQGSQIHGPVEHLPEGCERIRSHRNVATTILKNQTSVSRRRRQAAQTIRNPTVLSREHIREQLGVPPPKQHENSDQSNNSPSPLNYPESPSTRYRPGEGESSSSQPSSLLHSSSSLSEDRLSTTSSQLERYLLIHGESWTPGHNNNDDNEAAYDLDSDDESISYGESDMETWRDKSPEIGFSELHIRREKESAMLQNENQTKKHDTTTATTVNAATTTTTISKGKALSKKQLKKQGTTVTTTITTSSSSSIVPEKNSSSSSFQNTPKRRSSRRQQQLQQKQKGQKIYLSNTIDEQKRRKFERYLDPQGLLANNFADCDIYIVKDISTHTARSRCAQLMGKDVVTMKWLEKSVKKREKMTEYDYRIKVDDPEKVKEIEDIGIYFSKEFKPLRDIEQVFYGPLFKRVKIIKSIDSLQPDNVAVIINDDDPEKAKLEEKGIKPVLIDDFIRDLSKDE